MKINTKFEFLQPVQVKPLALNGTIQAIYLNKIGGIQYSVRYFSEQKEQTVYFFEDELDATVLPDKTIGIEVPTHEVQWLGHNES